jgi:HAD superfamily hydrolase (TIGR01458 family)
METMQFTIRGIIFDIDGVLEYQGKAYPGAAETILALRERGILLRFLTNSTLKNRASAALRLVQKGIPVEAGEVITASYATAAYLKEIGPRSVWLMLEREGRDEFKDFPEDAENPEYVVVGDYRQRFNFDTLNHALRLLAHGSKLVGMQTELVDSSMGELELNVGSWVGMLERAAGVQAVSIGKPNPYAFELALRSMGLAKSEVLMVGDRVATDVNGAREFGLRAALVRSGEFRPADLEGNPAPDFIIDSVVEILKILDFSNPG